MADAVIETDHGVDAARQALLALLDGPVRDLRQTSGAGDGDGPNGDWRDA